MLGKVLFARALTSRHEPRAKGGKSKGQDAKVASKSTRVGTYLIARQVRELGNEDPRVPRTQRTNGENASHKLSS